MVVNGSNLGTKGTKKGQIFSCKTCYYTTCHQGHWKRHLQTKKHKKCQMIQNDTNGTIFGTKGTKRDENEKKFVCECGKAYKYSSGYHRHKKTCELHSCSNIVNQNNTETITADVVKLLLDQQAKYFEKLLEGTLKTNQTINGNNNNTVQNNFNINVFLNEKCANALSIQDFAKQLKITMDDLCLLKNNEPKAITNIITKNLKDYTITERPFHNHQKKWYIKDKKEGWDKNGDEDGVKIVKNVKNQVSKTAPRVFVDNNPNFLVDEKQGTAYAETIAVAMKDVKDRDSNKILKNVAKNCQIMDIL